MKTPTKRPKGQQRRELAPLETADAREGPAMAVLTEKQKRFVRALFESPKTYGAGVFAARLAGHGNEKSSRQSLASMAYQMQCDPKIQAAIAEVSQSFLTTLGPVAVRAM